VNRPFRFQKPAQLVIRMHDETLSVAAMCVGNPDCSSAAPNRARIVFDCRMADDPGDDAVGDLCTLAGL